MSLDYSPLVSSGEFLLFNLSGILHQRFTKTQRKDKMSHDGVIVSFPGGSRGRFILNIVHQLLSNNSTSIAYTKYNSAHTNADGAFIMPFLDTSRSFTIDRSKNIDNAPELILTHHFPDQSWDKNIYLKDKKIIIMNITDSDMNELILNQLIKNVFPRLEAIANNEKLEPREVMLVVHYTSMFLRKYNISITYEMTKTPELLRPLFNAAFTEPYFRKNIPSQFFNRQLDNSERVLNLDYHTLFDKIDDRYVVLQQISDWLHVDYNRHAEFETYDKNKYNIFEKYCPWFLKENVK